VIVMANRAAAVAAAVVLRNSRLVSRRAIAAVSLPDLPLHIMRGGDSMPSKLIAAVAAFAIGSSAYSAYSAAVAAQQQPASSVEAVLNGLAFRNIGPFRTAAWVTAIAVPETPARDYLYPVYGATR